MQVWVTYWQALIIDLKRVYISTYELIHVSICLKQDKKLEKVEKTQGL